MENATQVRLTRRRVGELYADKGPPPLRDVLSDWEEGLSLQTNQEHWHNQARVDIF